VSNQQGDKEMTIDNITSVKIDASGIDYHELNEKLRELVLDGAQDIELTSICGQRYTGTGIDREVNIVIHGTPGNDLGAFMNGPRITVYGNAQDGCGNTMNEGEIIIHGRAGDITGYQPEAGKSLLKKMSVTVPEYI
jgi:glutamate synthase domain-containing protein 3